MTSDLITRDNLSCNLRWFAPFYKKEIKKKKIFTWWRNEQCSHIIFVLYKRSNDIGTVWTFRGIFIHLLYSNFNWSCLFGVGPQRYYLLHIICWSWRGARSTHKTWTDPLRGLIMLLVRRYAPKVRYRRRVAQIVSGLLFGGRPWRQPDRVAYLTEYVAWCIDRCTCERRRSLPHAVHLWQCIAFRPIGDVVVSSGRFQLKPRS